MRRLNVGIVVLSVLIGVLPGCKPGGEQKNRSISPELVTNPITASGKKAKVGLPEIAFEQSTHEFGIVVQGEKLSYTFRFSNTGGSDLIISNASTTCGCTVPSYSRAPIKPGEKGQVEVVFNSEGKTGLVRQSVLLLTNAQPNTTKLEITAEIYVPDSKK